MTLERMNEDDRNIVNNMVVWLCDELTGGDDANREFAESRSQELMEGVSYDALYAELDDKGVVGMDRDYTVGTMLNLKRALLAAPTVRDQQQYLDLYLRQLMHDRSRPSIVGLGFEKVAPADILRGDLGTEAQLAFLDGALHAAELAIESVLLETEIYEERVQYYISNPDGKD